MEYCFLLTFKVRELLIFVFWCLLVCSQTGGNPPLSGYVRFGETQLPVVSRTSSFGLDGSSFLSWFCTIPEKSVKVYKECTSDHK